MTNQTTGHTPGPWHTSQRAGDETSIRSEDGSIVAECNTLANRVQELANAQLIAAAPDMLLALGAIMDQAEIGNLSRKHPSVDSAIRRVLAAITIATKED